MAAVWDCPYLPERNASAILQTLLSNASQEFGMSLPPNIEKFNIITAQIFAILYREFPVPHFIPITDFGTDGTEQYLGPGIPKNKEVEFLFAVFSWLGNAGYITFSQFDHHYGAKEVVLTAKGLETLKAIPSSLSDDKTAGELVLDAVKSGASDSMSEAVKFILAKGVELIPYAVKAMS